MDQSLSEMRFLTGLATAEELAIEGDMRGAFENIVVGDCSRVGDMMVLGGAGVVMLGLVVDCPFGKGVVGVEIGE